MNMLSSSKALALTIFPLLLLLLWTGCGEDVSGVEGAIIDDPNNPQKLRELLFVVHLVNQNDRDIVLNRIDSVKVNVNGELWGVFTSDSLNREGVQTEIDGGFVVSDQRIGYLITAEYQLTSDTFETAGEYSSYLNRRRRLKPGDYVAEIAEVHFRDAGGSHIIISPRIYKEFTVDQSAASLYLGTFSIEIN